MDKMEFRNDWLALTREEILDPERPIVDPHFHLFVETEQISNYRLEHFQQDTSGHNIRQAVFVECEEMYSKTGPEHLRPVGETEWMRGPASEAEAAPDDSVRIRGIIADARLYDGARAGETLDAHLEASPLVRGVREIGLWDPSSEIDRADEASSLDLYGESRFRAGFEELAKRGLSFDAHQYHTQLPAVATLARAFPDTPIVINHLGSPLGAGPYAGRHDEFFPEWSRNVEEVATCPNVHMKLGGLAMPWSGFDWHERTKPPSSDDFVTTYHRYYDHALQVFGPERCMFESNFPVDKLSLSYDVLWNAFKKIAAPYSENERDALFSETAKRVYRLEDT